MDLIAIVAGWVLLIFLVIQISKGIEDFRYRKMFQGTLLLWQLGAVLKILHLYGANIILFVAPILAFTVKFLSFSKQQPKAYDVLVLIWLALFSITYITSRMHLYSEADIVFSVVAVLNIIVFAVLLAWTIYKNIKDNNAL